MCLFFLQRRRARHSLPWRVQSLSSFSPGWSVPLINEVWRHRGEKSHMHEEESREKTR